MSNRSTAADHQIAIHREMETYDAAMFIGDAKAAAAAKARADKHSAALAKLSPIPNAAAAKLAAARRAATATPKAAQATRPLKKARAASA